LAEPRLFTIPAGVPFLPALADALVCGRLVDLGPEPETGLAAATIYLPTRRAGRALGALLAERGRGRARLLPRIVPLGEADEAEGAFATTGPLPLGGQPAAALPPAIAPLERRLILTRLVQSWAAEIDRNLVGLGPGTPFMVPGSPADAIGLAGDLEALMDALATEDVAWDALADAVEIDYSQYFRLTLDFVRIAHEHWPSILAARGASDPARRRNAILDAEAARIASAPPSGPIIAAGSTGSIPSTARLLAAIAGCPKGAVVLPGLDTDLDDAGWDAIGGAAEAGGRGEGPIHGHPQYNLRRLVEEHCATNRGSVQVLLPASDLGAARRRLLSETLRPADTTDVWAEMPRDEREALVVAGTKGIRLVEAADEREEALAIAIALRETLAEPGRTAALVTPDRGLARRVAAELGRWGIAVEDSAGIPLSETRAGRLARLAADAAALDFQPARVLALLAHPDVTLGMTREEVERGAAVLEIGALRGPAPRPGLAGLASALELRRREGGYRDPRPRRTLSDEDWTLAADIVQALVQAFRSFTPEAAGPGKRDLVRLAECHADTLAVLRAKPAGAEEEPDAAGDALSALFDDLALASVEDGRGRSVDGRFSEYPAFFAALARERSLAPEPRATHRRVKILGLLEARLLHVDRAVLGGLDEGVWPPVAQTDAFLNRPMRLKLGLTPPERRIGQTAHDFAQVLANPDVIVTRAAKREGKPMVPSRFLARLRAFAGEAAWTEMVAAGRRYRDLAVAIDTPRPVKPIQRPAPQPGAAAFPRRLSVTEIETLVRDPYSIYAKHVLRLDPLEPLAAAPGAADLGNLFHDILGEFGQAHPGELPPTARDDLLQRGFDAFAPYEEAYPELYALWWPRFERFVPDYLDWEAERRGRLASIHVERSGILEIPLSDSVFQLRARADRIEFGRDGSTTIIDYKTGAVPTGKTVAVGFSPQLTLEASMLMAGGFRDLSAAPTLPALLYVKIGARKPLDPCPIDAPKNKSETRSMADIVEDHRRGLEMLVRRYAEEGAGYLSRPYPQYARKYAPYDHLARVKEWSVTNASEGE
jgi:ATP-dependent helicase/nuclease subunit B